MANASILRWDPTQPIFHWLAFGVALGKTQILELGNAKIYQHVGISNAKFWRRGHCPTPTPDPMCFASQWNIGFKLQASVLKLHKNLLCPPPSTLGWLKLFQPHFLYENFTPSPLPPSYDSVISKLQRWEIHV